MTALLIGAYAVMALVVAVASAREADPPPGYFWWAGATSLLHGIAWPFIMVCGYFYRLANYRKAKP